MQVIGASGTGKTKFLENLIRQDILEGNGLCLIDPTGNLYQDLVRWCETKGFLGRKKIALFEPGSHEWTFGFNPLNFENGPEEDVSFYVDSMVKACAQVWGGEDTDRTPLLKRCLRATFHVLAEKRLTLLEASYLVNPHDPGGIRKYLTREIEDFIMRDQWNTFNPMKPREFLEYFGSSSNRLLEFLASERIRRILGQEEGIIRFREVMDEGQVLLVNLSSGRRISEANASLLGALMVNDLFLKARGRPKGSRPFYLYIDECARFISEDIGRILDEGRQFGLHLILAHQHLSQLKKAGEAVYGAVMTDARTKVVFGGLSPEEAEIMGEVLYMGELDFEEAKTSLNKPVTVGYSKEWMRSEAETSGESWGTSESFTRNSGTSTSRSKTYTVGVLLDEEVSRTKGITTDKSEGWSSGTSESTSRSRTNGQSETMVPILDEMPTAVFSLEEQRHRKAADLRNLRSQQAVIRMPERGSVAFRSARVEEGYANPDRVERFKKQTFLRATFTRPTAAVDIVLRARRKHLEAAARRYQEGDDTRREEPKEPEDFLE